MVLFLFEKMKVNVCSLLVFFLKKEIVNNLVIKGGVKNLIIINKTW